MISIVDHFRLNITSFLQQIKREIPAKSSFTSLTAQYSLGIMEGNLHEQVVAPGSFCNKSKHEEFDVYPPPTRSRSIGV